METYFVNNLPKDYYNENIADAAKFLGVKPQDIVSIKLRPLRNEKGQFLNAYTSGWEYEAFDKFLKKDKTFQKVEISHNKTDVITESGEHVLYAKHESGVEFIVVASLLLSSMDVFTTVGQFIFFFLDHFYKQKKKSESSGTSIKMAMEERKFNKKVTVKKILEITNSNFSQNQLSKIAREFFGEKKPKV